MCASTRWRSASIAASTQRASQLAAGDAPHVVQAERLEDDDLVQPVDELGAEGLLHLVAHAPRLARPLRCLVHRRRGRRRGAEEADAAATRDGYLLRDLV